MTVKRKLILRRVLIIAFPLAAICILLFFSDFFFISAALLPPCTINLLTGYLCPGCGMTRAVLALVRLRIIDSIIYNPMAVLLTVMLILHLIEQTADAFFSKRIRLLPRRTAFWIILIAVLICYLILRNFLPVVSLR